MMSFIHCGGKQKVQWLILVGVCSGIILCMLYASSRASYGATPVGDETLGNNEVINHTGAINDILPKEREVNPKIKDIAAKHKNTHNLENGLSRRDRNKTFGPVEYLADWQVMLANVLYVYSAHLDPREGPAVVRLFGAIHREHMKDQIDCRLWFNEKLQSVVLATIILVGQPQFMFLEVDLQCTFPTDPWRFPVNSAISVRKPNMSESKLIQIEQHFKTREARTFTVCLWGSLYTSDSNWLVEWMEANIMFGAELFYIYTKKVSADIEAILNYYQKAGFLKRLPWHMPTPDVVGRFAHDNFQSTLIGDCQQRNINKSVYLVGLDLDELIVPRGNLTTWQEMIDKSGCSAAPAFSARHLLFVSNPQSNTDRLCSSLDKPCYGVCNVSTNSTQSIQRHFLRTMCITTRMKEMLEYPKRSKYMASPTNCTRLKVHTAGKCIQQACILSTTSGLLHHYRSRKIGSRVLEKPEVVYDNVMHIFRKKLSHQMQNTFRHLRVYLKESL